MSSEKTEDLFENSEEVKSNKKDCKHTLKIQYLEERAGNEPLVQVIGRGSRSEVAYRLTVPLNDEQLKRLQSMVLGNLAVAVPVLLMRALDELERDNKTLKLQVKRKMD
ncbi:hypothetical protein [Candidatus Albibeggiatoa sp. nov. NOAA]|uniref:hypothetical protein n=1 Tax=Candidatus Albibeggiatoa sp. nov. NOAA TaxID=3162724 RepID=UPI0033050912|nr:hypothetical protein [Thiotrichaceae bacterium]